MRRNHQSLVDVLGMPSKKGEKATLPPTQGDLNWSGSSCTFSYIKYFSYFTLGAKPDKISGRIKMHSLFQGRHGLKKERGNNH